MPKTPDEIFKAKIDHLLAAEKRLDKAVIEHQKKLYEFILSEYLPLFDLKDGVIVSTSSNDRLIDSIDKLFNKLEKAMFKDIIGTFMADLLIGVNMSSEYYVGLGFNKKILSKLLRDKIRLEQKLGVTPSGRLRKDSYLYRLGKTDAVRQQLKDYVIRNLTGDISFLDFQLGFRNLVIGNRRVKGLSTKGNLQQYFNQYAYDKFNEVDATVNKQMAAELDLKHFIYEGSVIKTTRPFCRKRAGKAFTTAETKKWKNDPDLIDKKTKDSYRPLVERGRYRCRHFIKYITKELYEHLTK